MFRYKMQNIERNLCVHWANVSIEATKLQKKFKIQNFLGERAEIQAQIGDSRACPKEEQARL